MRTTLDIPTELMQSAQEITSFKSKTDVVIFSLQELIRRKKIEKLIDLSGSIDLKIDLNKTRKRSKNKKSK
jgi:hypothetical protein